MAAIDVQFRHPTNGQVLTVNLDDSITGGEAISQLISNNFIQTDPQGYRLNVKGGLLINSNQTFAAAGVKQNDVIHVLPETDAG